MNRYGRIILFALLFIVAVWGVYTFLPVHIQWEPGDFHKWMIGVDWKQSFRPATLSLYSFQSPYKDRPHIFNPPWTFIPLLPLAILPADFGSAVMFVLVFVFFGVAVTRMGANHIETACIVFSPPVIASAIIGQVDWMVALGFTFPPQIGLFLVLVKPQLGVVVAFYWLVQAWKRGRFHEVARVFLPVSIAIFVSLLAYGPWFLHTLNPVEFRWNLSFFPFLVPVGIALAISSIKHDDIKLAIPASTLISPYVAPYSWGVAYMVFIGRKAELIAAFISMWIIELTIVHMIPHP